MISIIGYECSRCAAWWALTPTEFPRTEQLLLSLTPDEITCPSCSSRGSVRPVLQSVGIKRPSTARGTPSQLYQILLGLDGDMSPSSALVRAVLLDTRITEVRFQLGENEVEEHILEAFILADGTRLDFGVSHGGAVVVRIRRNEHA